jgi:hypothetical protein
MIITKSFSVIFLLKVLMTISGTQSYQLIYAVNAGGDAHVDVNGIRYAKDENDIGIKQNVVATVYNVAKEDVQLYSWAHYSRNPFHFEIPVLGDGKYWLILKFVHWASHEFMNVTLNNHLILRNFNPASKADLYTAYDEFIYFNICNNQLIYQNELSNITDKKIDLNFIANKDDIAVVSAIVLLKGNIEEISKLAQSNYTINEKFMQQDRLFECSLDSILIGAVKSLEKTLIKSVETLEKTITGAAESLTGSVQSLEKTLIKSVQPLEKTLTGAVQSLEKTLSVSVAASMAASVEKLINVYMSQQQHHEEKIGNIMEL